MKKGKWTGKLCDRLNHAATFESQLLSNLEGLLLKAFVVFNCPVIEAENLILIDTQKTSKMKKILLTSALLALFSLSIILFQLSCAKTAQAQQTGQTTTVLDKTLIQKTVQIQIGTTTDSSGNPAPVNRYSAEYYTINNDGSNLTRINITLPAGTYAVGGLSSGYLSPDNKKLIFVASNASSQSSIYALTLSDGSLVKLIDNGNSGNPYQLLNTY